LGTNLLTVEPGQGFRGDGTLPVSSAAMVSRIDGVQSTTSVSSLTATVRRSPYVDVVQTGGISVYAADNNLLSTLGVAMRSGRWIGLEAAQRPAVVLGSVAAQRLNVGTGDWVFIGGSWFDVTGVLKSATLAPGIDRAALMSQEFAKARFQSDLSPASLWVRADTSKVSRVLDILPTAANPESPDSVQTGRPSDALAARAAASAAYTSLFLGLGAVVLIVGGVGIANVMIVSVLERRGEIGLRRSLGATRRHIAVQFLGEAVALSIAGGLIGVVLGIVITVSYAAWRGWMLAIPVSAIGGGVVASLFVGAIAGAMPAMRAAKVPPTEALRSA